MAGENKTATFYADANRLWKKCKFWPTSSKLRNIATAIPEKNVKTREIENKSDPNTFGSYFVL